MSANDIQGFDIDNEERLITILTSDGKMTIDYAIATKIDLFNSIIENDKELIDSSDKFINMENIPKNHIEFITGYYKLYDGEATDEYEIMMPLYEWNVPTDYLSKKDADYFVANCYDDDYMKYVCNLFELTMSANYLSCSPLTHKLSALTSAIIKLNADNNNPDHTSS